MIEDIYKKIKDTKNKYGTYYKTVFHLHTPESYDYKLRKEWKSEEYKKKAVEEIFQECVSVGALFKEFDYHQYLLSDELAVYSDKKEWLSYVLLAHQLLKNKVELVLVTDHNTIDGIKKLKIAVQHLYSLKRYDTFTEVITGIEISCADKLHVVGIIENNDEKRTSVKQWLDEHLLSVEEGTYKTSLEVLEYFYSIGGMAYIAHINSSPIFTEEKYLSGGYKKKLFGSKCCEIIGISRLDCRDKIDSFLRNYRNETVKLVLDNDAHDVDSLSDNYFWLKGSKRNYSMVKEALYDFDVSVAFENNIVYERYIEGIYIEKNGFLIDKNMKDAFVMKLSPALNCLIGGRGTGKSTVLQMLDYCLGQNVNDVKMLDFLCDHGNVYVLYNKHGKEYMIEMLLPFKEHDSDNILRYFGQNETNRYNFRYYFDKAKVKDFARSKYLSIYEILKCDDKVLAKKVSNKSQVLQEMFDNKYSVNELVNKASSEEICLFIENLMFRNRTLANPESIIQIRSRNGLSKLLQNVEDILRKRKQQVEEVLTPFNRSQTGKLVIKFSQNEPVDDPDFSKWFDKGKSTASKWFSNHNITTENVIEYLLHICDQEGFIGLMSLALKKTNDVDKYKYSILPYIERDTYTLVETGLKTININNEKEVIDEIFDCLVDDCNIHKIIEYLKIMVRQSEKFSLLFNVNSSSASVGKPNYKDVITLSLGQKVVAMLDFVLGYGEFIGDYRPLLIDQPEDNLDSQYIYKNLVQQLRNVKEKRQIIIATHNATIVTNAMADQVCVMKSDDKNGCIEVAGYPSETKIKRSIVNYLEGGVESFKHKIKIYDEIL